MIRRCIFLSLLLFSCSKGSHWAFDQVRSDKKEFCSTKLTYRAPDPVNGINVELLKTEEHLKVFLNILSIPIAPLKGDPTKALLTMEIAGEKVRCEVRRLEGGQRFLLPEEIADTVIEALQNHQTVMLSLPGYRSILTPEDFSEKFEKVMHPFPFQIPFRLPI